MERIQENWVNILAVLGAVTTLLRVIFAMTKTDKDDQMLKKAETVLGQSAGVLAKIFGIDTTQGLNKPGKSRIPMVLLVATLLTASGCALFKTIDTDPRGRLLVAHNTFAATNRSLAILIKAGKITPEQKKEIVAVSETINALLKTWGESVKNGIPRPDLDKAVKVEMRKLTKYKAPLEAGVDPASVILILTLLAQGVGVTEKIAKLAQQILDGKAITDEDIAEAQTESDESVAELKEA